MNFLMVNMANYTPSPLNLLILTLEFLLFVMDQALQTLKRCPSLLVDQKMLDLMADAISRKFLEAIQNMNGVDLFYRI